jgi:hypothetical protein
VCAELFRDLTWVYRARLGPNYSCWPAAFDLSLNELISYSPAGLDSKGREIRTRLKTLPLRFGSRSGSGPLGNFRGRQPSMLTMARIVGWAPCTRMTDVVLSL